MRDKADHEATAMMKAQFMSLWDGEDYVSENWSLWCLEMEYVHHVGGGGLDQSSIRSLGM